MWRERDRGGGGGEERSAGLKLTFDTQEVQDSAFFCFIVILQSCCGGLCHFHTMLMLAANDNDRLRTKMCLVSDFRATSEAQRWTPRKVRTMLLFVKSTV